MVLYGLSNLRSCNQHSCSHNQIELVPVWETYVGRPMICGHAKPAAPTRFRCHHQWTAAPVQAPRRFPVVCTWPPVLFPGIHTHKMPIFRVMPYAGCNLLHVGTFLCAGSCFCVIRVVTLNKSRFLNPDSLLFPSNAISPKGVVSAIVTTNGYQAFCTFVAPMTNHRGLSAWGPMK